MSRDPQRTMRRVAALFRPYQARFIMLGLVVVLTGGLSVGNLLLIKPVFVDALFCPRDCPNLPLLFWLVAAMVAIAIVTGVLAIGQPYLANPLGQRVMRDLRDALYAHLQRMPLRFLAETKTGSATVPPEARILWSELSYSFAGTVACRCDTPSGRPLILNRLLNKIQYIGRVDEFCTSIDDSARSSPQTYRW
jgi:ABC-type multidrug transport system fused ATPase/permease subunit